MEGKFEVKLGNISEVFWGAPNSDRLALGFEVLFLLLNNRENQERRMEFLEGLGERKQWILLHATCLIYCQKECVEVLKKKVQYSNMRSVC